MFAPVEEDVDERVRIAVVGGPADRPADVVRLAARGKLAEQDVERELLDLDVEADAREVLLHHLGELDAGGSPSV